jgi:N-hydroxyarylamine O-acetyltransferase
MAGGLDLDAYFDRIGWGGSTARTYDTLAGLLQAHMAAIPFENLDVLLGRGIRIDLEGLQAKLVAARRGGYCFEHASLFAAVLDALGFAPLRHSARVVLVVPRDVASRGHMCLSVELPEGRFVLDPGFGGHAPGVPVPLVDNARVTCGNDAFWMARDGNAWMLHTESAGKTLDCWISTFEPDNPIDFEMANYWTSTHPASGFLKLMMLRALTPTGCVGVMNRDVTTRSGAESNVTQLADRAALRALLANHFGFDLPEAETLRVPAIPEWT